MNLLFVLSVACLAIGFTYVAASNFDFASGAMRETPAAEYPPPYYFDANDAVAAFNSFFFVFLFSLLFFGLTAPIALGIEGAKYGTLLSLPQPSAFDFSYAIPGVLAAYSAILLGQGVLNDFGSEKNVLSTWGTALKYLAAGLLLTGVLVVARASLGK
ncbi:MAG: hypothetical protein V1787_05630 [Candidatus Micrarchaeota archaeon]